jgi:hypothetical protein
VNLGELFSRPLEYVYTIDVNSIFLNALLLLTEIAIEYDGYAGIGYTERCEEAP